MEFIESLAGQAVAGLAGTMVASPALVIATVVVSLVVLSGLAARMFELVESWSWRIGRVRHVATNRPQTMPADVCHKR